MMVVCLDECPAKEGSLQTEENAVMLRLSTFSGDIDAIVLNTSTQYQLNHQPT